MFLVSGLMAALFSIRSLVFPLLALGSLLTRLRNAGGVVGGVMLIRFVLMVLNRLVEAFVVSLGLYRLFRGLRYGESSWPCNLLVLCIWELTMVIVVLFLLSL